MTTLKFTIPSDPMKPINDMVEYFTRDVRADLLTEHNTFTRVVLRSVLTDLFMVESKLNGGHIVIVGASDYTRERANIGYAFCSPKDSFDLLKGVMIAVGRYDKRGVSVKLPVSPVQRVVEVLLSSEITAHHVPSWARP